MVNPQLKLHSPNQKELNHRNQRPIFEASGRTHVVKQSQTLFGMPLETLEVSRESFLELGEQLMDLLFPTDPDQVDSSLRRERLVELKPSLR